MVGEEAAVGDTVVVQLSEANKIRLFNEALRAVSVQKEESVAGLKRLTKFNPDVAAYVHEKEDAISNAPFRLLFQKDAPVVNDTSIEVHSYLVVSYCWHNQSWTPGNKQQHSPWPFCKEIANTIMGLRESDNEGVFLDQACIDQNNATEKVYAIASMNIIYRSARRLIILLEDVVLSSAEERLLIRFRDTFLKGEVELAIESDEMTLLATMFTHVASSRWFTRAWCGHEIKTSKTWRDTSPLKSATVRIYNEEGHVIRAPLVFFAWVGGVVFDTLSQQSLSPLWDPVAQEASYWKFSTAIEWSPFQRLPAQGGGLSYAMQYGRLSRLQCLIPSDRINIALNICGISLYYDGPAESDDECFYVFWLMSLALGQLSALTCSGSALRLLSGHHETNSWACRPLGEYILPDASTHAVSPESGIIRVSKSWIELDIYKFHGQAKYTATRFEAEASSLLLTELSNQYSCTDLRRGRLQVLAALGYEPSQQSGPSKKEFNTRLLAICIEQGTRWILKVGQSLKLTAQSQEHLRDLFSALDHSTRGLASRLLAREGRTPTSTPDFTSAFLDPVRETLFVLMHPDFWPMTIQDPAVVQIDQFSYNGLTKAVTFPTHYFVAIPTGLAYPGYALNSSRAWVIEPVDYETGRWPINHTLTPNQSTGVIKTSPIMPFVANHYLRTCFTGRQYHSEDRVAWRVVEKIPLLGFETIKPDGRSVSLLRAQRVWGGDVWYDKKFLPETID